jgi:CHAD domain-containing protein
MTALRSARYLALLEHIEAAANSPVVTDPDVSLEEIAAAEFRKLRRAVRRAGKQPSDAALHRIRVNGKRARHAAELAEPRTGKPAARFVRRVKDLQDLLGEHHDAVVAEQRLRNLLAKHRDAKTAFMLGLLIERQRERRRDVRKAWPKVWTDVRKSGRAAWN